MINLSKVTLFAFCMALTAHAISPNSIETELAALIQNHADQQRSEMVYDPALNLAAREKARDFSKRGNIEDLENPHTDSNGYSPHQLLNFVGYELPWYWSDTENYIESATYGYQSATSAFNALIASQYHRMHVLAEHESFQNQTRFGIGYFYDSRSFHKHYYVVITAPPEPQGDSPLEPYVQWLFDNFTLPEIDAVGAYDFVNAQGTARVFEFLLNFDPDLPQKLPAPVCNEQTQRFEWTLPFRSNTGSITYTVEHTPDLATPWSTEGIEVDGNTYSVPLADAGFWRIRVNTD